MIPHIRKILYATDLSKNSSYAFYFAAEMAQKHSAKIIIFHCVGTIPASAYYVGKLVETEGLLKKARDREKEQGIAEIKKRLGEFCQKVEPILGSPCIDLVSAIIVREGYAVDEILNAADEEGCDIVVLGTHGKGLLKQAFLGSVARSVLERTRKPVYIIPLPSDDVTIDWASQ